MKSVAVTNNESVANQNKSTTRICVEWKWNPIEFLSCAHWCVPIILIIAIYWSPIDIVLKYTDTNMNTYAKRSQSHHLQRHTVFYPVWQLTESPQTELREESTKESSSHIHTNANHLALKLYGEWQLKPMQEPAKVKLTVESHTKISWKQTIQTNNTNS